MTRGLHEERPGDVWSMNLVNCRYEALIARVELDGNEVNLVLDTLLSSDLFIVAFPKTENVTIPKTNTTDEKATGNITTEFVKGTLKLNEEYDGEEAVIVHPFEQSYELVVDNVDQADPLPCNAHGIMGLARNTLTSNNETSVLGNLLPTLKQKMFAIFVSPYDDTSSDNDRDDLTNGVIGSSHLVWGGVDYRHYQGCLDWFSVGYWEGMNDTEFFQNRWDFEIEGAFVGGETLPENKEAVVDGIGYPLRGPKAAVAEIIRINQLVCYQNTLDSDFTSYISVPCDMEYDLIALPKCSASFESLGFYIEGSTYYMDKEALMYKILPDKFNGLHDLICGVHILPSYSDEREFWILGNVFLKRYYAVFDFEGARMGFAARSNGENQEKCPDDWPFDIQYDGLPIPDPTDPPVAWAPPTMAPVAPVASSSSYTSSQQLTVMMALLAGSILGLGCFCLFKGRRKRRRQTPYSLASRFEDDDGFEMT